jgi:hypothetical protein
VQEHPPVSTEVGPERKAQCHTRSTSDADIRERYELAVRIFARAAIRLARRRAARAGQPPAGDGRTGGEADTPEPTDDKRSEPESGAHDASLPSRVRGHQERK